MMNPFLPLDVMKIILSFLDARTAPSVRYQYKIIQFIFREMAPIIVDYRCFLQQIALSTIFNGTF